MKIKKLSIADLSAAELLPFIIERYDRDERCQGYWDRRTGKKISATAIILKAKRELKKAKKKQKL